LRHNVNVTRRLPSLCRGQKTATKEVRRMAHVHDAHGHGSSTVIETDREGPAMAIIVLIVVAALALLVWFFAFSGIVIDRGNDTGPTINNEQQDTTDNTNTDTGGNIPMPGGTGG
jgi:hypothetical protein